MNTLRTQIGSTEVPTVRMPRRTLGIAAILGFSALGLNGVRRSPAAAQDSTTTSESDSTLEANKALVRRVYVAFSGGDPDDLDAVIAEDFAHHPLSPGEQPGRAGFKGVVGVFRTIFPDFDVTLEDIVAEGDRVAIRGVARGTHQGDLFGIPPTGVAVTFGVADVYRVSDGEIREGWHQEDFLSIFQQIGAYPPLDQPDSTPTT